MLWFPSSSRRFSACGSATSAAIVIYAPLGGIDVLVSGGGFVSGGQSLQGELIPSATKVKSISKILYK